MSAKIPHELGYHMPAEWEPHEGTWISWPKDKDSFPEKILEQVENIYLQMIQVLQKSEKVFLLVNDNKWEESVRDKFESNGVKTKNVVFHRIKSVDVWTRDYGPIFIKHKNGEVAATKWIFNAWGGKYDELKSDNKAGEEIVKASKAKVFTPDIILEGGSIDVNGKGTLLTTEGCLLNKNRNSKLSKTQIEEYLKNYLGVENFIWLKEGIAGDDTDGHVDDIARFVNENTVVCAFEDNPGDENYAALKRNFELLGKSKDQDGDRLNVVKLPMPGKVTYEQGRLPASYANFYIANKSILLPIFNHKNDKLAIGILQNLFPKKNIVPIYCTPLTYGFGAIHCVTQQQPLHG